MRRRQKIENRMFNDIRNTTFPVIDKEILEYWDRKSIFKKSLAKNKNGKKFVFYEGPPTANGSPHLGHVLPRAFKDLFPRYKTMKGFYCERKGGWDTQGLPVEIEVEKELGFSGKLEIEKYGVAKFNQKCRESVFKYVEKWNDLTRRIGFWLDLDNPYVTMDPKYIESVWWLLKQFYDQGLLIKDYKVLPYCPRCGTPLSSHELAQGYKETVDTSVYVKFPVVDQPNTYLLAWTTTPWTIPGNVALAVSPQAQYVKVNTGNDFLILARDRLSVIDKKYVVVLTIPGEKLVGLNYVPPFGYLKYDKKAHFVVPADFVSLEDGTGIVHTAVMYGAEDFELGTKIGLPKKHAVDLEGKFIPEVKYYSGMFVKKADPLIVKDLKEKGLLYKSEPVTHDYPFCWRCKTPLLYYALESYFIKTTAKKELIQKLNDKIDWHPSHLKKGRMGEWLSNMVDWSISRSRFWGTPIPIWRCSSCQIEKCVGSFSELKDYYPDIKDDFDPHKPEIDEITFKCSCGGEMKRVPYVLDCWFDSGAMPFAQIHYPFDKTKDIGQQFPADFICEAIDQTRGWFYTLLAISALHNGSSSYKTVLTTGHALDNEGRKMSKSLKNVVDPFEALDKYGADIIRWNFYTGATLGNNFRAGFANLDEVKRRFFTILVNSVSFFVTYANLSGFSPNRKLSKSLKLTTLDHWILSRLNNTILSVTKSLDNYDANAAAKAIEFFVVNDLSTWYIRRSKNNSSAEFFALLREVFITVTKLMAPFAPFVSEKIYLILKGPQESVHLEDWPTVNNDLIDPKLEKEMAVARSLVEQIHARRQEAGIKLRQPLSRVTIKGPDMSLRKELIMIMGEELNTKEVVIKNSPILQITLITHISQDLLLEGQMREIIRSIQDLRKKENISYDKLVDVSYEMSEINIKTVEKFEKEIKKRTLTSSLTAGGSYALIH